jgi:D-alanyl-lipoteichoic acid acyltransferase DltB (MBOAT superfamily)
VLFSSHAFVFVFLPLALAGWFALIRLRDHGPARAWLLLVSVAFYAWWSVPFLAMLLLSIVVNHRLGARVLDWRQARPALARAVLTAGVCANLALLGGFKYGVFFGDALSGLTGIELTVHAVVLPLGISFYTFQQIGFLVDAWRGRTRAYPLADYAAFVLFFPQLIAGPIVHHAALTPQFRDPAAFRLDHGRLATGIAFFAIGLAKKLLLADPLTALADPVFDGVDRQAPDLQAAWLATAAFGFGLYFDFSAYSDMAIGLARMFGFTLPYNFDSPYRATSIVDFWRRWHMTLSSFLRDYVYVPLGGNRHGPARRHVNLMLTMLLGGLWHGAAWTFVAWGALHGVYLLVAHAWQRRPASRLRLPGPVGRVAARALTLLAVMLAWIFFRADGFEDAWSLLRGAAGLNGVAFDWADWGFDEAPRMALAALAVGTAIALFAPNSQHVVDGVPTGRAAGPAPHREAGAGGALWRPNLIWAGALGTVVAASIVLMSTVREFVYFQF